jgi:hypothetical protein
MSISMANVKGRDSDTDTNTGMGMGMGMGMGIQIVTLLLTTIKSMTRALQNCADIARYR